MTLRCLFVDFDSFFASVEQFDNPELRGKPVAVVPVIAENTCCLAASYPAKALGIKTGTGVRDALQRCPEITLLLARPARYVELHRQLMDAIADCIPHGTAASIDEVPCWLIGRERERDNAVAIAQTIKQRLRELGFSPAINCSIGIAPNKFLAKTASDMDKPDGLTVLEQDALPGRLHELELRDFCGIGPSMERRLHQAGIQTSAQLCAATRDHLRAAWGSIEGERYWLQLRGFDLPERVTRRASIGHSHVLGPELRSFDGARAVLFKLLAKAAMRLRKEGFLAGGLAIRMRFVGLDKRFERDLHFAPIDDTPTLLAQLAWQLQALQRAQASGRWRAARHPPLSVAVTLVGLESAAGISGELVARHRHCQQVSRTLDAINRRYGNNAVYFGAMQQAITQRAAPMRIPFSVIPDTALEQDVATTRMRKGPQANKAYELWLQRERQFKVLAERTHQQSQKRTERLKQRTPFRTGAWSGHERHSDTPSAMTGDLF